MEEKARSCMELMAWDCAREKQAVAPLSRCSAGSRAGPQEQKPRAARRRISASGGRCSAGRALKDEAGFVSSQCSPVCQQSSTRIWLQSLLTEIPPCTSVRWIGVNILTSHPAGPMMQGKLLHPPRLCCVIYRPS